MKLKVSGVNSLYRRLKEISSIADHLDGELAVLSMDPYDPQSIEAAIKNMESEIDRRTSHIKSSNTIAKKLIVATKSNLRDRIVQKAAAARLSRGDLH